MTFTDALRKIVSSSKKPLTPQEIGKIIKSEYPEFYGTEAHLRNVEKGHYKDKDHALLAQIYIVTRSCKDFYCDHNFKPIRISLVTNDHQRSTSYQNKISEAPRKTRTAPTNNSFDTKALDIVQNADRYHQAFYELEAFGGGPGLYFHQRAIETCKELRSLKHFEYVYATLASWGMHRLGKGGSKMVSFETFGRSVAPFLPMIEEAQQYSLLEMSSEKWETIRQIFFGIKVMATGTSLVGNSKLMHHMIPNLVPPIDREYTLRFLRGNINILNDIPSEWQLMKGIIINFFTPVISDNSFQTKAQDWMLNKKDYPWDTSPLKIVDNLIIGFKKLSEG